MTNQAEWLEVVSGERVDENDSWGALTTQIAADLLRLADVLKREKAEIGGEINNFMLAPSTSSDDCAGLLAAHREEVLRLLPEVAREPVSSEWSPAAHLSGVRTPSSAEVEAAQGARFNGETPKQFRTRHFDYAVSMAYASKAYREAGLLGEAFRAGYRADLAAYFVFLIDMANRTGDWSFASMDVRESLARRALSSLTMTDDLEASAAAVRNALQWSTLTSESINWSEPT